MLLSSDSLEHFVDLEPEAAVVVAGFGAVGAAVYFSREVELRVPVVRLGVAEADAPAREVVYLVGKEVFRRADVYEGGELEARYAERVAQFACGGVGGVAVAVAVGVGADAVDAAEEELFAAVEARLASCPLALTRALNLPQYHIFSRSAVNLW